MIQSIKNKLAIASAVVLLHTACSKNELIPAGLILTQQVVAKDSTYLISGAVPSAELKNVMIEEFTGVGCANCPGMAQQIKNIQNANPNRVLVAKIHSNFLATPLQPNDPDFRVTEADALYTALGATSKPNAGIDRIPTATGSLAFTQAFVASKVADQMAKSTPINIDINNFLNATKDSITISASITFTEANTDSLAFHVYILENGVEAAQDSLTYEIDDYHHEEILRKCVTPTFIGTALPDGVHEKGRVYIRALKIAKPSNIINIDNCSVLVFVAKRTASSKEVLQSRMEDL